MKVLTGIVISLVALSSLSCLAVQANEPEKAASPANVASDPASIVMIRRSGSQPSAKGTEANFTGSVRVDMPFATDAPSRASGGRVTFEPGARSAWHTHPLGQTLMVTAGTGWVQQWGGPVQEIKPGDVVWIPPSVKHWHGATATTGMTHIAIAERIDGRAVDWMEKVGDDQYGATAR